VTEQAQVTEDKELLLWWRRRRNELVTELSQAESCIRTLEEVLMRTHKLPGEET
jgi:hypothetical protein